MKKNRKSLHLIGFGLNYVLKQLEDVKKEISEDERDKWTFEWDYSDCYYEGDTPSVVLEKR